MFIFECTHVRASGRRAEREFQAERERETDRIRSRLCAVSAEPNKGLDLTNHEIMTLAEIKSGALNRRSHQSAPLKRFKR